VFFFFFFRTGKLRKKNSKVLYSELLGLV